MFLEIIIGVSSFIGGILATKAFKYIQQERDMRRRTRGLYQQYLETEIKN